MVEPTDNKRSPEDELIEELKGDNRGRALILVLAIILSSLTIIVLSYFVETSVLLAAHIFSALLLMGLASSFISATQGKRVMSQLASTLTFLNISMASAAYIFCFLAILCKLPLN